MHRTSYVVSAVLLIIVMGVYVVMSDGEQNPVPNEPTATTLVPVIELAKGTQSTVTQRRNYVINSNAELSALWKLIDEQAPHPTVNFETSSVVAVFSGTKPTAGHSITVTKIADSDRRMVTVTLQGPDSTCFLAEFLTAPYQIIEVPKTSLPYTHQDETVKDTCRL
jgi:hypothetical protein